MMLALWASGQAAWLVHLVHSARPVAKAAPAAGLNSGAITPSAKGTGHYVRPAPDRSLSPYNSGGGCLKSYPYPTRPRSRMRARTRRGVGRDGLVTGTILPTMPRRVDDELTDLGRGLSKPVQALGKWAFDHKIEIETARAKFDGRKEDR